MSQFSKFIIYNFIVYVLYMGVDKIFTFLHLYSSDKLGQDLSIMPTQTDTIFIFINVIVSTIAGYVILRKINSYINGE